MNIVVGSRFFPVCFARYFLRALKRTGHSIISVGPYTENHIPWAGGMQLDLPPDLWRPPDIQLAPSTSYFYPRNEIEDRLPWTADLWLDINSTFSLFGKPRKGIVAAILVDQPTVNYDLERAHSDYVFGMQKAWCKNGDIWLPFAYDPEFHAPLLYDETDILYDIAHIGVLGKARSVFGEMAKAKGYRVNFQTGPAYHQIREIYQKSRLIFSWSTRGELVGRVFEALAMGRPLLCDLISPENGLYDLGIEPGRHYRAFSDLSEALAGAKTLLQDYYKAIQMAMEGRMAVRGHSYDARIRQILSVAGGEGWI